jgi:hypothetical protein
MCCYNAHTTGGDMLNNAYYSCICTTAHCSTQCALTDCSQSPDAGFPQMGDPCDLCEQMYAPDDGGGVCGVTPDCAGNADCLAYAACENTCTQ